MRLSIEDGDFLSDLLSTASAGELTEGRGRLAELLGQAWACAAEVGDDVIAGRLFGTLLNVLREDQPR